MIDHQPHFANIYSPVGNAPVKFPQIFDDRRATAKLMENGAAKHVLSTARREFHSRAGRLFDVELLWRPVVPMPYRMPLSVSSQA
jgi:hypothetical protein